MRKQPFFQAAEEYQRKLKTFGCVQSHESDLGAFVVSVGVADQGSVIEKLVQSLAAVAGIHGGIHQFAQVLDSRVGLGRVFLLEQLDVTSPVNQKFQDVSSAGSGRAERAASTGVDIRSIGSRRIGIRSAGILPAVVEASRLHSLKRQAIRSFHLWRQL